MGQKVHPYGFRLGFNRGWHSNWIAKRDYADLLHEDLKLKRELKGRFAGAGVSHIDVERAANKPPELLPLIQELAAEPRVESVNRFVDLLRAIGTWPTGSWGPHFMLDNELTWLHGSSPVDDL